MIYSKTNQSYSGQNCRCISIADIGFSITVDNSAVGMVDEGADYNAFISSFSVPDVKIDSRYNGIPDTEFADSDLIFDSEGSWALYGKNGNCYIAQRDNDETREIYTLSVFNDRFTEGTIHTMPRDSERLYANSRLPYPLDYPLGELVLISLLSQGRGIMAHACGIDDNGSGYLFIGQSGAGKSTMAQLWNDSATILNDDRIIIRENDGRLQLYPTPWHGDFPKVTARGAALSKVFFISHAQENFIRRLAPSHALKKLLACSFMPQWDRSGIEYSLSFCERIVQSVPCYALGFAPDNSITGFVRCAE